MLKEVVDGMLFICALALIRGENCGDVVCHTLVQKMLSTRIWRTAVVKDEKMINTCKDVVLNPLR
jgi:hypothetical protein